MTPFAPAPGRKGRRGSMTSRESAVIDAIDALVDEQLQQEKSGYDHNINQTHCSLCRSQWHGLAADGCPGAFASDGERESWQARYLDRRRDLSGSLFGGLVRTVESPWDLPPDPLTPQREPPRRIDFPSNRDTAFLRPLPPASWRREDPFLESIPLNYITANWYVHRPDGRYMFIYARCGGDLAWSLGISREVLGFEGCRLGTMKIDNTFSIEFSIKDRAIHAEMLVTRE